MRKKTVKRIVVFLLMFCLLGGTIPSDLFSVQVSAETKASTVKNGWKKESSGWCYYVKGKKLKNTWKTINKKKYYFGSDGARKTGWYTLKVGTSYKSCYFDTQGVYKKSKAIDGTLVKTMDKIIKSQKITSKTKDSAALKSLFEYVRKNGGYQRVMGFQGQSGWEYDFAKQMLETNQGSCYHYAAAFAFLAKRATGLPVRICWGTSNAFNTARWQPHAWVEIKIGKVWYTYDANAAKYSSLRKGKWYHQKRSAMEGKIYKTVKYVEVKL